MVICVKFTVDMVKEHIVFRQLHCRHMHYKSFLYKVAIFNAFNFDRYIQPFNSGNIDHKHIFRACVLVDLVNGFLTQFHMKISLKTNDPGYDPELRGCWLQSQSC